ncbi:hypothetical protein B0I35DRAFT_420612 [Stachybotrys elegans]|uniref:Glycosyl transferase n=1 Tax=Stachybotrys elegans TaxID=80388 RepID=A0A8K0T5F9_9HYPO|nr:hypothetical protein B0I35DRAFT_420612 [Stachybotrys elegans]
MGRTTFVASSSWLASQRHDPRLSKPFSVRVRMRPHLPRWARNLISIALTLAAIVIFLLSPNGHNLLRLCNKHTLTGTSSHHHDGTTEIPNTIHFVSILPDPEQDFDFQFSHFLSIYAAWFYWRPSAIYLHTNTQADGQVVTRAQNGTAGKWAQSIFTLFNLQINQVEVPAQAGNGMEIKELEHRSDFVRVKAIHDFGGVYIDWDVHALRDIAILRSSGFNAVAGRQMGDEINSGVFMSKKNGRMITLWMKGMHEAYTGGWTAHSNGVLTKVGQRLVREVGEVLIMERNAFAPGSWKREDCEDLFQVHADEPSNLDNYEAGKARLLPLHQEPSDDRWDHTTDYPGWARDWSSAYLLHAFSPARWGYPIEGFHNITPRYVLERRSNFARAVYPIAQRMFTDGLVEIDDTHTGF